MAKRFKLRIPSLLSSSSSPSKHQDQSTFPLTPLLMNLSTKTPPATKRQVSVSVACGCRPKPKKKQNIRYYYKKAAESTPGTPPRRKIYNSEESDSYVSSSPAFLRHKNKLINSKPKTRFSNASVETEWFSSDDFSKTFSTDSCSSFSDSGMGTHLDPINETPISGVVVKKKKTHHRRHNKVKKVKYYGSKNKVAPIGKKMGCDSPGSGSLAEEEEEEGKMKESMAVMKKSENPYGDFRRSMMEMIVEKEMFETKDLELLLQCFLSLNSRQHYGVIIEAFSDIWEILFCESAAM